MCPHYSKVMQSGYTHLCWPHNGLLEDIFKQTTLYFAAQSQNVPEEWVQQAKETTRVQITLSTWMLYGVSK